MGGGARGGSGSAYFFDGVLHALVPLLSRIVTVAFEPDDAIGTHNPVLRNSVDIQGVAYIAVGGQDGEGELVLVHKGIDQSWIIVYV